MIALRIWRKHFCIPNILIARELDSIEVKERTKVEFMAETAVEVVDRDPITKITLS